jgi:hypothetical protein
MMAGLSIIPVFSWYWMFIALPGLYRDMDKATKSYGRSGRFGTVLILAACIFWLVSDFVSYVLASVVGLVLAISHSPTPTGNDSAIAVAAIIIRVFSHLQYCAVTLLAYWIIRNKVIAFIDIKSSVGK